MVPYCVTRPQCVSGVIVLAPFLACKSLYRNPVCVFDQIRGALEGWVWFSLWTQATGIFGNYVNPVCCVAPVCHQVCCMYWGHLGHFHGAISHLKWYKIVCMRYLALTLVRWNLLTCFPCFCNVEFPDISFGDLLRFEHRTSLFSCLCISMLTSNSSGNMRKHRYLGCFHAASAVATLWCY